MRIIENNHLGKTHYKHGQASNPRIDKKLQFWKRIIMQTRRHGKRSFWKTGAITNAHYRTQAFRNTSIIKRTRIQHYN